MFRPLLSLGTPVAVASLALVACGGAPAAPATPIGLSEYAITAPASIPASMATFTVTNSGKEAHQAGLARLDSGKTVADFLTAVKDTTAPLPKWVVFLGGAQAGPGAPPAQFMVSLEPGNYAWYCFIPGPDGVPHVMKGMTAPMTVTAASGPATAPPEADVEVTVRDYQWDLSKPITAGHHVLKITTAPGQPHEMVIVKLNDGKTAADMLAWAASPKTAPPISQLAGIGTMGAGEVNYEPVDFTPGHYAFLCFVHDKADGKPHAMHGMVKEFTVQ